MSKVYEVEAVSPETVNAVTFAGAVPIGVAVPSVIRRMR